MSTGRGKPQLLHVFPGFEAGGAQLRTCAVVDALGPGHCHLFVTLDGGRTDPAALLPRWADVRVETLPAAGTVRTVARIRRVLARERPDLVLTHDWGAFDAVVARALAPDVPLLHYQDGFTDDESFVPRRRREWARRLVLPGVSRVVVPSRRLRNVAERAWRVDARRIEWIPNGVDAGRFAPRRRDPRWRAALGIPAASPLVGTVGRLSPVKGLPRLLEACALLAGAQPDAYLVIAGEGAERASLERRVQELGLAARVRWLGRVDRPELVYPELDVFALASNREEHPLALLEAMASGLAVVATRVGDVEWSLPSAQHPLLVNARTPDAARELAAGLARLLGYPHWRAELGRRNRAKASESFGHERMLARHVGLYERALAGALS